MMRHQAEHYHDDAGRRLRRLVRVAGGLVWVVYAAFMIIAIFQIAGRYLSQLPR
jgi:hypothetical protein